MVRQDLRTVRPTGWVQLNFWVSDVGGAGRDRAGSTASSVLLNWRRRIGAKSFVFGSSRTSCAGIERSPTWKSPDPEGFMIGFDQANDSSGHQYPTKEDTMKLSARNQFQGTVTRITEGQAMAEVAVKVGNLEFIAAITEGSVKNMGLKLNDSVTVAVKATEVMIGK